MPNRLEIKVIEMTFQKDRTVIETSDGEQYAVESRMPTGEKIPLEFFHNEIFPTSTDRLFGTESMESMRN